MVNICLDYGHGGKDSGAVGMGVKEKGLVLQIGTKVTNILKQHNVEVIHTRTTDVFVELNERAQVANKANADVFVSLHCNSFSNPQAQGVEVYAYPNSLEGKGLARDILDSIVKDKLYTKNRGLKTANFAVLRRTRMPSALVELGFISNIEDVAIMVNKQDELAEAVAKGILNNLGAPYNKSKPNDPYSDAVKTLVQHGIIGTPSAWADATKIKPANARALTIKMADYLNQGI